MKMNKLWILPLIFSVSVTLVGCSSGKDEKNDRPTVSGVRDFECLTYSRVDLLDGIAALDTQEGDITPKMDISINPAVEVVDGYATFTKTGNYVVTYSVEDNGGLKDEKSCTIEVMEREVAASFNQPDGFSLTASGQAEITQGGMVNGEYVINGKGGILAEDLKLSRAYEMVADSQYTFTYVVNSNVSGKIKATADGKNVGEFLIESGADSTVTFAHKLSGSDGNVNIALCFGLLGDDIQLKVKSVSCVHSQKEGDTVDLTQNFKFNGRIISRIENGNEGNAYVTEDNKACLEITRANGNIWEGGAFIDTGVTLKTGQKYVVSYNVHADFANPFEVIIQRGQWNERKILTSFSPDGAVSETIEINNDTAGELWLYVQSGNAENKITLSDLSVMQILSGEEIINVPLTDFTETHAGDTDGQGNELYKSTLTTDCGKFIYEIENFADTDWMHKVSSRPFFSSGSADNYVITFIAKASAPVTMVFAAPVYGGWDPTLAWSRITLSQEEQQYTIYCGGDSYGKTHQLVWQFGDVNNMQYHNVKIEISDVRVNLRHEDFDGEN